MTRQQLLACYPLAAPIIERLCAIDSDYGAQQHQREFIQRCHACQHLAPCVIAHVHDASCYGRDVIDKVARDQQSTKDQP